ncbi:mitochondrial ribonuclease P catalytic subunit-like [Rhopilema esculentum]|uniref:mitochondrial ribonuclease P catalytic subunit-like n=1 Tax=Rhopilema esculentum TaxID=499914 RepID=UPI0031D513F7|eukprot:gene1547-15996_t
MSFIPFELAQRFRSPHQQLLRVLFNEQTRSFFCPKKIYSRSRIRRKFLSIDTNNGFSYLVHPKSLLQTTTKSQCSRKISQTPGKDTICWPKEGHDSDSFRVVVQKFRNLELKPNPVILKEAYNESRNLVDIFINMTSLPDLRDKMIENLNTFLNFYDIFGGENEFYKLSSKMKSYCIANEATYYLIIRHETRINTWKDGLKILENMESIGIEPHARTFHHIILNAVKEGDLNDALGLLKQMRKIETVFHDQFYGSLIDTALEKGEGTRSFVLSVFDSLINTGFTVGPKTFGSAKRWFESDKKKIWKVGTSLVNLKGICKCCGSQLKRFSLPIERRESLQKKLFDIAETSISKVLDNASVSKIPDFNISSSFNPQNKINEFKHYLSTHGPFDVVLDVLNIAYYRDRGFNSFQVKRVVRHFLDQRKHVLALCSSPLLSTLLEKEVATDLPNYHMVQLLHYLRRQGCGIFFVDDKKEDGHIDDYFILLSMVYQNMDIDIITADKFGDHIHTLDINAKNDFKRWMRSHQIVLTKFTDTGKPIFPRRENYDIDVQSTKSSWHFPGPNKQWLCCIKK